VKDLVGLLSHQDKDVQSDSIKVLYEIAELRPSLVEAHCDILARLLASENNRLVWGAMTALDALTETSPRGVHAHLEAILKASRDGSVITRDHAVGILIKLAARGDHAEECIPLLLEELRKPGHVLHRITASLLGHQHPPKRAGVSHLAVPS